MVDGVETIIPDITDPIHEGVNQLKRYMNTRGTFQGVNASKLFNTNAFVVVSCRTQAKSGTISSNLEHFLSWKDPYPKSLNEFGSDKQDILVAGILNPQNLLEIMRDFTVVLEKDIKKSSSNIDLSLKEIKK